MNNLSTRDRKRKLMMLGGIGLGLAMLGRKRRWRRYAMNQMVDRRRHLLCRRSSRQR